MKRKRRILIVEDNSDLRRLYAIGLNQLGFEVKLATNGAEAVERIQTDTPDVILLDLIMPIMDGWQVIQRIASSEDDTIPVIVVSGQPLPEEGVTEPGINAWLTKPVALSEIAAAIENVDRQARRP